VKKIILILVILCSSLNINADNYREIGSFQSTYNEKDMIEVGVNMNGITNIKFRKDYIIYLNPDVLSSFSKQLSINLSLIDTVTSENIDISYSGNTNIIDFGYYDVLASFIYITGDGGEESCSIKIKYITQTGGTGTKNVLLSAEDIRQLQQLIDNDIIEDLNRQDDILRNKVIELNSKDE